MARAGFSSEQLGKGSGFGFGKGNGLITDAVLVVHQNPESKKEGGGQEEVRPKVKLTIQRLDNDWNPTTDDAIEDYIAIAGKGGLEKFHPGNAENSDDDDPSDLGDELGTEGNSIFVNVEGSQISENSKFGVFAVSLEKLGFKPELLNGYLPNLVGLEAHFDSPKMKSDDPAIKDYPVLVVDKINKFPYQKGGKTGTAKPGGKALPPKPATKPAAGAAKPAVKAATKPAPEPEASGEEVDAASEAMRVLGLIGEKKAGQTLYRGASGTGATKLSAQLFTFMNKDVDKSLHKDITAMIKDDEWFASAAESLGWQVDGDDINIPAA